VISANQTAQLERLGFLLADQWIKSIDETTNQIEAIKNAILPIVEWIDTNVIKPVFEKFKWLCDKIAELWAPVAKFFGAVTGQTAPTVANPSGGYTNVGSAGVNTNPAGGYGQAAAGVGTATDTGGGTLAPASVSPDVIQDKDIAAERAKFFQELSNDPALEKRFAAIISKEQGSQGGRADVMEATVNRALSRGQTAKQALSDRFFGPQNRGEVDAALRAGLSQKVLDDYSKSKADVAAGRNRLRGMTDQGMANEIHSAERLVSEGEHYGRFGTVKETQSAAYRRGHGEKPSITENAKKADEARGPVKTGGNGDQNLSMNPVINIHGVPAGQEGAVGNEVKKALQDPSQRLLSQMKRARDQEARLGYV
jgi:hypothetical protein